MVVRRSEEWVLGLYYDAADMSVALATADFDQVFAYSLAYPRPDRLTSAPRTD